MSLDQAYQEQDFTIPAAKPFATRIHVHASPLLLAGLEQIFDGMQVVMVDATLRDPYRPFDFEEGPELFIVEEKFCPIPLPEMIGGLRADHPATRVVLLSDIFDLNAFISARRAGVDGFCLTTSSSEVLLHSISLVMLGETVVPWGRFLPMIGDSLHHTDSLNGFASEKSDQPAPQKSLSSREVEVLDCLREGAPNKIIARKLNVAEATVKVHVKAILRKLGVGNRSQAAIWAAYHLPQSPTLHDR